MKNIKYIFKNKKLLEIALSHRSVGTKNNERFEFLGDSLINFLLADELFKKFPNANEGQLTRMRSYLACGDMMFKIAKKLQISDYLIVGLGELKTSLKKRKSILVDTLEAIIGAIYLDSGKINTVRSIILEWYTNTFDFIKVSQKDSKTILQEYLQSKNLPFPIYEVLYTTGKQHNQIFHVQCKIIFLEKFVQGIGNTKKEAEKQAASIMLKKLYENN